MQNNYSVTSDLFAIPYKDSHQILYAPEVGFICSANQDLINLLAEVDMLDPQKINEDQKAVLSKLKNAGVLNGNKKTGSFPKPAKEFCPTAVTLFPTNQCNLRCQYCYASAGDDPSVSLDWDIAVNAVELVIDNNINRNSKQMSLGFHGGGEPLLPWEFIKKIVQYSEKRCEEEGLSLRINSATNGVLNKGQLEWIVEHFSGLNISFDGLPEIQDTHRPLVNGRGSFAFVDETIRFLDEHNFPYGIRSTISTLNIDLMKECLEFIATNYKTKNVQFEPMFYCGRCKKNDDMTPEYEKFYHNFTECISMVSSYDNLRLSYSGFRVNGHITNSFCGVCRDNFSITPDGYITSCYEVTKKEDPKSDTFFIGKINKNGQIELDEKRRLFLNSLTVDNLEYCKDCFAKWHCGGECVVKLGHDDYQGERGHDRCKLNRIFLKDFLVKQLNIQEMKGGQNEQQAE